MRKLSCRANGALLQAGFNTANIPVLAALVQAAARNPGIEPVNYFSSFADKVGFSAYRSDCRTAQKQWGRVKSALIDAALAGVTDVEILAESPHAYSGRWAYNDGWHYTAGQYYCTEYRQGAAALIEAAARRKRHSADQLLINSQQAWDALPAHLKVAVGPRPSSITLPPDTHPGWQKLEADIEDAERFDGQS